MINTCKTCGQEFVFPNPRQYCSHHCQVLSLKESNHNNKKEVICTVCNTSFLVPRNSSKQICNSCRKNTRENSYRILSPRKCEICGKEFSYDWRSDLNTRKYTEVRFCSASCSKTFSSKTNDIHKLKQSICVNCRKSIFIKNNASPKTSLCEECHILKYGIRKKRNKRIQELPKEKILFLNCKYCGRKISISNIKKHERACNQNPNAIHSKHDKRRKDCREGYIYLTTNLLNGKSYVGKHVGSPENSKTYLGSGIYLLNAVKKYGKENFKKVILEYIKDGDLNEREIYWIEKYDTYKNGYNMTRGGDGNRGMLLGRHWYTNGEINVLRYECPEGFSSGITYNK